MVVLLDDARNADVGRHHQHLRNGELVITAPVPVVVLHDAVVETVRAVARVHHVGGVNHAVLQRHHDGCRLEYRPGFHHVRYGVAVHLAELAVRTFRHVHNGFHVARGHFHHHGHAHTGGAQVYQLLHQGCLRNVLHVHVEGAHDVAPVNGRTVFDAQVFVHHLLAVCDTRCAPQQGVESQFQPVARRVLGGIDIAQRVACQRPEGFLPLVVRQPVESPFVSVEAEDGQLLHFFVLDVRDASRIEQVVAAVLFPPILDVGFELRHALVRKDAVQASADGVEVGVEERVFLVLFLLPARFLFLRLVPLLGHHEVHVNLVFRQAARHQLSVCGEDVASGGLHLQAVADEAVRHPFPVLPFTEHDDTRLGENKQEDATQEADHEQVTERYGVSILHALSLSDRVGWWMSAGHCSPSTRTPRCVTAGSSRSARTSVSVRRI